MLILHCTKRECSERRDGSAPFSLYEECSERQDGIAVAPFYSIRGASAASAEIVVPSLHMFKLSQVRAQRARKQWCPFNFIRGASAASAETVVPLLLYTRRERSERRDGSAAHFTLFEARMQRAARRWCPFYSIRGASAASSETVV